TWKLAFLLQLVEALVCLSAIYVVRSASAARRALSPYWLLVYLCFNVVAIVYMQLGVWVVHFDPARAVTREGEGAGTNVSVGEEELRRVNWDVAAGESKAEGLKRAKRANTITSP